jgi:hypothetical protein
MFTNHGKEDGIYPLKEIAKHKTRIRDLLLQHAQTPVKDLPFQLIESIIVQYKDET